MVRLPVVVPSEGRSPGLLVSHPDSSSEILQAPGSQDPAFAESSDLPDGARPGVFQKLIFDGTWLASGRASGFGMSDLSLKTVLGFPMPTRRSPLLITPGFGVHYLDGPVASDLPSQLYDAYTQFRWMSECSPR